MKKFKKNQKIIATLPTGREVEGYYIEPYGETGHSFYVMEFSGIGKNGASVYKKQTYGVKEEFIDVADKPHVNPVASESQYKAWLKRSKELEERIAASEALIKEAGDDEKKKSKEQKKIDRYSQKLCDITAKIMEYESHEEEE